jgi:hypothetical protein
VGAYGDSAIVMHGLEHDDSTGTLYAASSHAAGNGAIYTVNKATGLATLLGSTGLTSFTNLVYHAALNKLFATNSNTDSFYEINRATGAATLIGALTGPTNPNGLAYGVDDGVTYMVDNNTDLLYKINVDTGIATSIGSVGSANLLGLAYVETVVPEPTTLVALVGVCGLALRRRR